MTRKASIRTRQLEWYQEQEYMFHNLFYSTVSPVGVFINQSDINHGTRKTARSNAETELHLQLDSHIIFNYIYGLHINNVINEFYTRLVHTPVQGILGPEYK